MLMNTRPELLFFTKWLQSPLSVASVTPSSPQLAQAMAARLPQGDGAVVELGGGTGSITRALLQNGIAPDRLIVVERDAYFCSYLKRRFPDINVICGDALCLESALNGLFEALPIRTVVSGLPMLSMTAKTQKQLLEQSIRIMESRGIFVQFSYAITSPLKKRVAKELDLQQECVAHVWRNVPPAKVWVYREKNQNDYVSESQQLRVQINNIHVSQAGR